MQPTALRYALGFLAVVVVWMVGKALQGPQDLQERDALMAKQDPRRRKGEIERLLRRLLAVKRKGDRQVHQYNRTRR